MSKFITKTVDIVFGLFCVFTIICMALSGGSVLFGNYKSKVLATLLLLGCILFFVFGNKLMKSANAVFLSSLKKLSPLRMAVLIGIITFTTKLFFVLLFQNDANLHPDMQRYQSFANQIADNGTITEYVWYAYRHKRTAIYGLLLSPFAKLFGSSTQALTIGLTLGITIASILLFDIIRKYTGNTIAFIGILIYNLMPFGLFQTQLLVHETSLLFFHILGIWLLFKTREKQYAIALRIVLLILSAFSIALGKSINPAGDVIVISIIIFSFVDIIGEKISLKKLLHFGCFLLIFILSLSIATFSINKVIDTMVSFDESYEQISEKNVPYGWTIYLAFNYERNGVWNKEDYETYYKYQDIEDTQEAKDYQVNLIKERLSEYGKNPIKIPILMGKKFYALWGDLWLSFYYEQGNSFENFFYTGVHNLIFVGIYLLTVICNLVALTTILFSRKRKLSPPYTLPSPALHFKMVVLGVTIALLFSEVMSKYTSHLVLPIYAIWMLELKNFSENSAFIHKKITSLFLRH